MWISWSKSCLRKVAEIESSLFQRGYEIWIQDDKKISGSDFTVENSRGLLPNCQFGLIGCGQPARQCQQPQVNATNILRTALICPNFSLQKISISEKSHIELSCCKSCSYNVGEILILSQEDSNDEVAEVIVDYWPCCLAVCSLLEVH